ncbi:hypothetical protein [Cystobacter fuscus]|uniref:hypothetical protein n=1 Tax=Cystobacter fuscus TaxID=43 RepID=UPI0005BB8434|nr:hypothetical protein [Cystobacter fuscus]
MRPGWTVVSLPLLAGCGSTNGASSSFEPKRTPAPGARPAVKKELPWLNVPGGRMRTTLFYGPWQCRREFMNDCQRQCAREGHPLKGCMWLADLKFDWEGQLILLPIPVEGGSRYGIYHCCCDYPALLPEETTSRRREWERIRKSFRQSWSEKFGVWPSSGNKAWPGHHIRDLWHSGDPVDPNNVFPAQPDVHDLYNRVYPACYAGQPPWNTTGPDVPYTDH